MKTTSKLILLLSDLHVGSTVGLWPADFTSNEGNPIGQNKFQEWLWKCWSDAMEWSKRVVGKDAFDVVLNGDLVDGIHHKTLQVMTPDVGDQTDAVKQVLAPLVERCAKLHIVKGTEIHTRNDEIRLGNALGARIRSGGAGEEPDLCGPTWGRRRRPRIQYLAPCPPYWIPRISDTLAKMAVWPSV